MGENEKKNFWKLHGYFCCPVAFVLVLGFLTVVVEELDEVEEEEDDEDTHLPCVLFQYSPVLQ